MPTAPRTFRWTPKGKGRTFRPSQAKRQTGKVYDAVWQKLSRMFRAQHPWCALCGAPAECVDHIVPISQGGARLDEDNLRSLCWSCHSKITLAETNRSRHRGGGASLERFKD